MIKNILIVDDSKLARKRVCMAIDASDIEYETINEAIDGEDGLKQFLKTHPDILITDIEMPKMNGIELITKIRQIKPNLPIIAITSIVNEKTKKSLMANKYVEVLHKPIDNKIFSSLIDKIIEGSI